MSLDTPLWPVKDRAVPVLRDEAKRQEWMRKLNDIARVVETADPAVLAGLLAETRRAFSDSVRAGKSELLGNTLCWDTAERETAQWIAEAYGVLARAGTRIAERTGAILSSDAVDAQLAEVIVPALVGRGNAQKWHAIAGSMSGSTSLARVHGLFRLAERRGVARTPVLVSHEGVPHTVTVEGMYLRVLLFGFLFTGHLSRQQVEILDSWLWPWVGDYRLDAEPRPGELGLWVDLQAGEGVKSAFIAPSGLDVRFLVASRLEAQLDEVVGGFHAGVIFPGYGVSTGFRIEEHVAVVEFLQRLVQRLKRAGGAVRSARRTLAMPRIEAFVGVGDILRKGFSQHDADPDRPRRWLRIRDVSESGLRLMAPEKDWESIEVGDLIGLQEPDSDAFVVGEVVRKLPDAEPQCVQLGVSLLSREACRMSLEPHGRDGDALDVLYLPGNDNCGREDSLLAGEKDIAGFGVRDLKAGGFLHAVQPNRVRRRGRGWAAAGFEVLSVRPIG